MRSVVLLCGLALLGTGCVTTDQVPNSGQTTTPRTHHNTIALGFEGAVQSGVDAMGRGDFQTAERTFVRLSGERPRDAKVLFLLGTVQLRQDRVTDAEATLRKAIALDPRLAEAHAELGSALYAQNKCPEASEELKLALQLDHQFAEAMLTLGLCAEETGDWNAAIDWLRKASRAAPEQVEVQLQLAHALASAPTRTDAQRTEAVQALRAASSGTDQDAQTLVRIGTMFRELNENADAVRVLERARVMTPDSAATLGELAQALWSQGDHTTALARAAEAVSKAPDRADILYVQALMLAASDQREQAIAAFRRVETLDRNGELAALAHRRAQQLEGSGSRSPRR